MLCHQVNFATQQILKLLAQLSVFDKANESVRVKFGPADRCRCQPVFVPPRGAKDGKSLNMMTPANIGDGGCA